MLPKVEKAVRPYAEPDILEINTPSADDRILLAGEWPEITLPFPMPAARDDWAVKWIYNCTPVVAANQMGYVLRSPFSFSARWDGGDALEDVRVWQHGSHPRFTVSPHFGLGTFTIQTGIVFRTPPGVGLYVKGPPNWIKAGVSWLEAFVETDQLRRDFTFNLRLTEVGKKVTFEVEEPFGCVLPYPLDYLGKFDLERPSPEQIESNRQVEAAYAAHRNQMHDPGFLYRDGHDAFGNPQRKAIKAVRRPKVHRG
jgi:hypothetical protein